MTLREKLEAQKAKSAERFPAAMRAVMDRATDELERSGILERVLGPGERLPEFVLPNTRGEQVSSKSRLPLVLTVYRGVW